MRTAKDFNREYYYKLWTEEAQAAKHPAKGSAIKNAIFYSLLLIMVMLAFFYSGNREPGKRFGPFAYNTVLTPSMNSVYPQGSLITSWAIQPDEYLYSGLEDGTDIVFILEDGRVVVHRIIEIIEDYEGSGHRAFRTQGVDNPSPDPWITIDANIIGRVTWHVPFVGDILALIADNILWVILTIAVISIIIILLSIALRKE